MIGHAVDWNEVSAIGQCAGAIATVAAVIVSLYLSGKSGRSKIRIRVSDPNRIIANGSSVTKITVRAINDGPAPITIESSSFYALDSPKFSEPCGLPKKLDVSESIAYELEVPMLAHVMRVFTNASGVTEITFRFIDSRDKVHEMKYKLNIDEY